MKISKSIAKKLLLAGFDKAKILFENNTKIINLIDKATNKMGNVTNISEKFAIVPKMIEMLNSYIHKEYTDMPKGTIISIISALVYFISPLDAIIDGMPVVGLIDDVAVVAMCYSMIEPEVKKYEMWKNDKMMNENEKNKTNKFIKE